MRGTDIAVGIVMGASEGVGVTSNCGDENPQAVIVRKKMKHTNPTSCFEDDMAKSFFEESIGQLYKQAAHMSGL